MNPDIETIFLIIETPQKDYRQNTLRAIQEAPEAQGKLFYRIHKIDTAIVERNEGTWDLNLVLTLEIDLATIPHTPSYRPIHPPISGQ